MGDPRGVGRAAPSRLLRQVGRRIAELRAARDMTQERLAELLDVTPRYVRSVEGGRENLALLSLARIARRLRVPVVALLEPPAPRARRARKPRQAS